MRTPLDQGIANSIKRAGIAATARAAGVHPHTLTRAIAEGKASPKTIAALERIKDRLRTADEFKGQAAVTAPRRDVALYTWSLELIRRARDNQQLGDFKLPVALAAAMRTDDALFSAYHNRIAPHAALATTLEAAPGARGKATRKKALVSVITPRPVLQGIVGTLADHGIAIGYVEQEPSEDGTRIDFMLTEWPLEHVKWNTSRRVLETTLDGGGREDIIHGNGRWIVFRKFSVEPWKQEACVLPGAMVWASHANGIKDWAAGSASHGQAKVIGALPEGWALRDGDGNLTAEAQAFIALMRDIVSGESGAGIRPHGSEVDFISNGSTAWQVFKELITDRSKAAARIYLGTDAMLGSVGGAPGVDIAALFGVATTKIQGDVQAIEDGLNTGLYQPWAAVNEGDSRNAPRFKYLMPDPDASQSVEQIATRREKFFAALAEYRTNGMQIDQSIVTALAKEYRITPPLLAPIAEASVPLQLAPTDVAKVVRADEIRRSQGLPALGDARGNMTIPEIDAAAKAQAAPPPPGALP